MTDPRSEQLSSKRRESDPADSGGSSVRRASTARTILVVDDDEDFLDLVLPVLRNRGHRVIAARSGAGAQAAAAQNDIDLVVIDGLLPDTDGITWITSFRRRDPDTPVVFMSAFWGLIESLHRSKDELKVALVVHKPVDSSTFCQQLERCQEGAPSRPVQLGPDIQDEEAMRAVRDEYARMLPSKLQELAQRVRRAKSESSDSFLVGEIRTRAHRLRGTAGCYGFHEVGAAAGVIEDTLVKAQHADHVARMQAWEEIDCALSRAAAVAEQEARESAGHRGMPLGVGGARILVIDGDPLFLASLEDIAQEQLIEVVRSNTVNGLGKASASPPDAAILALSTDESHVGLELARRLRALPGVGHLPLGFVCADDRLEYRLAAAKLGSALYLGRSIDADTLGLAVRQLLAMRDAEPPRILIVSANDDLAGGLTAKLESRGHQSTRLRAPNRLFSTLEGTRPDVLLVDIDASGLDICRMLRSDPDWQSLPALLIGENDDAESRLAAFDAGADDFIVASLDDAELFARIHARLDRMRLLRERFDKDLLTDLPLRRPFLERLGRSMAESRRHGRPLTIGLLDVDLFKSVNDRHGHHVADRVLATLGRLLNARFRAEDLRGRWGGEEFVVAFPGETSEALHGALAQVLDEFGALQFHGRDGEIFHTTFSVGVAGYPNDGASVRALLDVADRRLFEAKRSGRARVVSED